MKILGNHCENYYNHKNHRNPFANHETLDNHENPYANHEHYEKT